MSQQTTASVPNSPNADYRTPAASHAQGPPPDGTPLLQVRDLRTYFPIKRGVFQMFSERLCQRRRWRQL